MSIRIENISKRFGQFEALSPLSLDVAEGDMVGLLGPSGSGKTTLLRIIAGLETANTGRISFGERDVTNLHVRERKVGFVFQNYALFRHMTVSENIAFGLEVMPKQQRLSNADRDARVKRLLERVQLSHLANRYPSQLSGGQKQRIALARALATHPEVLLLDEPFGALDAKVRKELRHWLRGLHDELGFTSVFVTHDQEEALELSDRVVVMSNGHIEQVDTPVQLYSEPASRFVFEFLGNVNIFSGEYRDGRLVNGDAWIALTHPNCQQTGQLYVRSHEFYLAHQPSAAANLPMQVMSVSLVGAEVRLELAPQGWSSEHLWDVTLSHAEFARWQLSRGESLYLSPAFGYFFHEGQEQDPVKLSWQQQGSRQVEPAL